MQELKAKTKIHNPSGGKHMQQGGTQSAQVQKSLGGLDFPATREDIIDHAKRNGASNEILQLLEELPRQPYENAGEVTRGFGNAQL